MSYALKMGGTSNKSTITLKNLGAATTINIANLYPSLYRTFTINNFFYRCSNGNVSGTIWGYEYVHFAGFTASAPSFSYNRNNGVLTANDVKLTTVDSGYEVQTAYAKTTSYLFFINN